MSIMMLIVPIFLVMVVVILVGIATLLVNTSDRADAHRVEPGTLFTDDVLLDFIDRERKIEAIKYYREETGVGLKEAKEAVEFIAANRDNLDELSKRRRRLAEDLPMGAGVQDLLAAGEFERAVTAYREFMGVDEYTARDAVEVMQAEMDDERRADEQ